MTKTALITGASSGFGLHFARLCAQDGANLVLVARSTDKLNNLKTRLESEYGVDVVVIARDLSHPDAAEDVFATTEEQNIKVDILINNAGFGILGKFEDSSLERQQQMLNLNILTLTKLTHLYLPHMKKQHYGKILNVASIAAFAPGPCMATYYASKAYVLSFSDALATELRGSGVTVTALCPGPVNTGFANAAGFKNSVLFNGKDNGKAAKVSCYGYNAMVKGKTGALPDIACKIGAFGTRIAPRKFAKWFIYTVQNSRIDK